MVNAFDGSGGTSHSPSMAFLHDILSLFSFCLGSQLLVSQRHAEKTLHTVE